MASVRLIVDEAADGAWNMAVDEALLASAAAGGPPTLRFYAWSQATLSLGYFQRIADRERHPASNPCPVVRRSTGGGAIVHDRELTYSYTAPLIDRFAAHAVEMYDLAHTTLIDALAEWSIAARRYGCPAGESRGPQSFLCFQRRADQDVVVGDDKIAGSAQRRRQGALLQHGSVLLGRSSAAPELAGLAELTGRRINVVDLVERWSKLLAARMATTFEPSGLTADERRAAAALKAGKFAEQRWTERR